MIAAAGSTTVATMVLTATGTVAACAAFVLPSWWSRRAGADAAKSGQAPDLRRMPAQWPLVPRPVVGSAEERVWHWLEEAFPEHRVLIKLPVTRFTLPRQDEGRAWFDVLSTAYCTFTVADSHGHVFGCVDVTTATGQSRANRALKQRLLAQCGIGYWVLSADALPDAAALRTEFLGAAAGEGRPSLPARTDLDTAREQLHQALDRNRGHRQRAAARQVPAEDGENDSAFAPWQQADSFLGDLDSRRGDLAA